MSKNIVLFNGVDNVNHLPELWVTDGTSGGTAEISVAGADTTHSQGLNPRLMTTFGSEVLFEGVASSGLNGLWITDGTSSGTSELSIAGTSGVMFITSQNMAVLGSEVLFGGEGLNQPQSGLWISDGTAAGTSELSVAGVPAGFGLSPSHFTVFGSEALFVGVGPPGSSGLWVTDGTAAGTSELSVADAYDDGLFALFPPTPSFAALGNKVVFEGWDSKIRSGLWVTDGTSAGTSEITLTGGFTNLRPTDLTTFGSEVLFSGTGFANGNALWVTDGTSVGTSEISVANTQFGFGNVDPGGLTVFGSEVLFAGTNVSGKHGLWVTDGTSAGTSEITVTGASSLGVSPTNIIVFGGEVLFNGVDAAGHNGVWVTDGTSGGTSELTSIAGASANGLNPTNFAVLGQNLPQPALSSVPASVFFAARGAPVTLAPLLQVSDTNVMTLVSATVAISGGAFNNDGDVLVAVTGGTGITASYNSSTETLTLTGSDTLADYQQVLESVTFGNASANPSNFLGNQTRTVTWVVNDGTPSNNLSAAETTTVNITHPAPTLSGVSAAASSYTEEGAAVTLSPSMTITDQDSLTLTGATVLITGGTFAFDHDTLSATTGGTNIAVSYDRGLEALTLTGVDTLAHYQAALDSVTFSAGENPANYGSNPTRTISWVITDNGVPGNVNTAPTTKVSLVNVNDPPSLFNLITTPVVFPNQTVTLLPFVGVSDPDNLTLAGATVAITGGTFGGDGDMLAANTAGTPIAAIYDPTSETLTLTGADTLAHYAQVLRSVTFASTNANPGNFGSDETRTFSWVLNDGGASSNLSTPVATTISFPSVPFDLNGDANSDVVFQNGDQAGVWLMKGATPIAEAGLGGIGAGWHIVTSRDLNGDGKADLIWQNTDGTGGIWLMNGTTPIAEAGFASPGASWHIVAAGDFNGDGMADLFWQNSDGTLGVWLMNGITPIAEAGLGNPGANWKVVGAADYTADGRDDVLLQNTATGDLRIEFMKGTTVTGAVSITVGDPSWHAVSTGEFNGQAEIAWQNTNGTPAIWLMNGTAPVAEVALPNPGPAWQVLSVDHFTPDGQASLLFQNTNGQMGLWEMNGTNIVAETGLPNPGAGWQSVNGHPFTAG